MTEALPETPSGGVSENAIDRLLTLAGGRDAVVLGPGLGQDPSTQALVRELVRRCPVPLLVDADGLNALAAASGDTWKDAMRGRPSPTLLTPHPGEMARLVGRSVPEIQRQRVEEAVRLIRDLDRWMPNAAALAVTGGEPLEQTPFLARALPLLKREVLKDRPVLLETGGLHPEEMARLVTEVGMVSMDLKLPSTSGLRDTLGVHRRFMDALAKTPVYVKAVVNRETTGEEIVKAASLVAEKDPDLPFFLQPEVRGGKLAGGAYLLDLHRIAGEFLRNVRVLPQIHGFLDLS